MATFLQMQDAIANETVFRPRAADTDFAEAIRAHINEAIRAHQHDRFYFNEQLWVSSTEAGVEFYPLPGNYVRMLTLSIDSPRAKLDSKTNEELEEVEPRVAFPEFYAIFSNQYRLHPTPDATYGLRLFGVRSFPDLVDDGASNPWTTDGYELIREAAKARIFYSVLHDEQRAQMSQQAAMAVREDLDRRTKIRQPPSTIRPWL